MSVRAGREFLAIPGPTTVPDEVLRAMHRPTVDIYSGPLLALTDGLLRDVARLFNTAGRAYIYIANGHGAWEATVTNVLSKGDKRLDCGLSPAPFVVQGIDVAIEAVHASTLLAGDFAHDPEFFEALEPCDGGGGRHLEMFP